MRSTLVFFAFSGMLLSGQVFPTIDPNAHPTAPVRPVVAPAAPAPGNAATAGDKKRDAEKTEADVAAPDAYVLGPQDTLNVRVVDLDELGDAPYPIDLRGNLTLPRIGRVHASGKTVEELEGEIAKRYREYLQEPVVSVSVAEFHSQPISILGAVENPGVHQIRGNKTLFEVISEAGGLKDDAGNTITITRKLENGMLPLKDATTDASGRFSVAEMNIRSVMSAKDPGQNIAVKPYDVITVPKADLIYVIGSVKRPGGFPLSERANMTVLEALALAQGLEKTASSKRAKILRTDENTHQRSEILVDVQRMMEGKLDDAPLLANDILFVPSSTGKTVTYRAIEALVSTGTGIAIYRP
jgi:polysaccharide export outer membrane protein